MRSRKKSINTNVKITIFIDVHDNFIINLHKSLQRKVIPFSFLKKLEYRKDGIRGKKAGKLYSFEFLVTLKNTSYFHFITFTFIHFYEQFLEFNKIKNNILWGG